MINAFHPDFMKTYYPDFMKDFRTHDANRKAAATLTKHVEKVRKTKPNHGTIPGLEPKVFHVYSKAGKV